MHEIAKNGPVQMLFKVHCDFFMYKSGIYSPSPRASVPNVADPYHAVKVLGWGTDENGVDYWIAANSWGPNWGEVIKQKIIYTNIYYRYESKNPIFNNKKRTDILESSVRSR